MRQNTTTRTLLSFDVGTRHLAYCKLSYSPAAGASSVEILGWDLIDLGGVIRGVEHCAEVLTAALEARFANDDIDLVLIERQPKHRSIMMVAVQMFLCEYFTALAFRARRGRGRGGVAGRAVRFIHAREKLRVCGSLTLQGEGQVSAASAKPLPPTAGQRKSARSTTYAMNKKAAIAGARQYLESGIGDFANLALFDMYAKKDDLADALLQAISYIRHA